MTDRVYEKALRTIKLPVGILLEDGTSYLLEGDDIHQCKALPYKEFKDFDRFIVLSDGNGNVVGGLLFYGSYDIQAFVLEEYRGQGYLSSVCKNGVLTNLLYNEQQASITESFLESKEDLEMKEYLLSLIGITPKNKESLETYKRLLRYMKDKNME